MMAAVLGAGAAGASGSEVAATAPGAGAAGASWSEAGAEGASITEAGAEGGACSTPCRARRKAAPLRWGDMRLG